MVKTVVNVSDKWLLFGTIRHVKTAKVVETRTSTKKTNLFKLFSLICHNSSQIREDLTWKIDNCRKGSEKITRHKRKQIAFSAESKAQFYLEVMSCQERMSGT